MTRIPAPIGLVGAAVVASTFTGCDLVDQAESFFDGLTNPLVGVGLVLGADLPDGVDLAALGIEAGVTASVFLADVSDPSNLDDAPVTGAAVDIAGAPAVEEEDGLYVAAPEALPAYVPGEAWTVTITRGAGVATMTATLPPAATVDLPASHAPSTPVTLDVTGQGFDGVLVVVVEASSQEVTWTNMPESAGEVFDLVVASDPVETFDVPAEAFPNADLYLVGVAGLRKGDPGGVTGANTTLSTLAAGRLTFHPTDTRG